MFRIRRLYFYLVLYVSLSMLMVGIATALRTLLERTFDVTSTGLFGLFVGRDQIQEQTALGTALVLVGLPVWLLHWRMVQNWCTGRDCADERSSGLRRLYVYAVLLTTALTFYSSARDALEALFALVLRLNPPAAFFTGTLPFAVTSAAFCAYHWRVAAQDRRIAHEDGASATLRRWYVYAMLVFAATPLMINLAALAQRIWEMLVQPNVSDGFANTALAHTLAGSGATLAVALGVWMAHDVWTQRMLAVPTWYGENEHRSVLRKVYLYGMVLVTVAWALFNASEILRFVVASALAVAPSSVNGTPVVVALGNPLANVAVFGLFWTLYWQAVRREAASQAEIGRQAGVRRLYFYLVSAIALGFVGWSAASLLRLAGDTLLQTAAVDTVAMRGDLARSTSWLVIGLPVWLWHWRLSQLAASGPRALEETRSTTRRWYLYVVAFASVAVLLFSAARVVYEVVLLGLGRGVDNVLLADLAHSATDAVVAGAVLAYHWFLVLRSDVAAARTAAEARQAVAVIAGLDNDDVARLQEFARTSLDGARTRIYWTDQAHAAALVKEQVEGSPREGSV